MATDKRLIDLDKLKLAIKVNGVVDLDDIPTVDAVEVVRCKDCRYRSQYSDENGMYHCGGIDTTKDHVLPVVAPDFFCSYGERRTNA